MVDGVHHMHKHGMFHRDLKLENIVLDSHYTLKLMDFGHSKHASECEYVLYAMLCHAMLCYAMLYLGLLIKYTLH